MSRDLYITQLINVVFIIVSKHFYYSLDITVKNHHVGLFWKDTEKNQKSFLHSGTYAQGPEKKPRKI